MRLTSRASAHLAATGPAMLRLLLRAVLCVVITWPFGCAPPAHRPAAAISNHVPAEFALRPAHLETPLPSNPTYATDPEPAAEDEHQETLVVERCALDLLRRRGQDVRLDGRLARLARWGAERLAQGELPGAPAIDAAARRLGHAGAAPFLVLMRAPDFGSLPESTLEQELRRQFDALPGNLVLTRYGVGEASSGSERVVTFAVASVELTLEPVPKHIDAGATLHLAGRVADRFDAVRLSVLRPHGPVRSMSTSGRVFAIDLAFEQPGVHRIELLGEGASGPVVVANLPLYVDASEPDVAPARAAHPAAHLDGGAPLGPALAEQVVLDLLNEARGDVHIAPLVPDVELASIARSHSEDMAEHLFFGHVSPTSGGPDDRVRRADVRVSRFGENLARAASPEDAYATLMDSPAHRANMLDPSFTHVGIGAAVRAQPGGEVQLHVTLLFARLLGRR